LRNKEILLKINL